MASSSQVDNHFDTHYLNVLHRNCGVLHMSDWQLDRTFQYHGRDVRYTIVGHGTPVVVVHGTPWSSYNMRHIARGLSRSYKVHAYDLLGYGESDKRAGDVSLGIQNDLLKELIQYWQLSSPIVIGHDFGGATVLRAHLIDRVPFDKIVLIDPVALSPWGSEFFLHVRKHEEAFSGVPDYIHEAILRAYISTAVDQGIDDATMDRTIAPWQGQLGKPAFYRQIAQADSKYTDAYRSELGSVQPPVLILWGENDSWIPSQNGAVLHSLVKNSRFVEIPNSGHLVIEEQPKRLLSEILAFVEQE